MELADEEQIKLEFCTPHGLIVIALIQYMMAADSNHHKDIFSKNRSWARDLKGPDCRDEDEETLEQSTQTTDRSRDSLEITTSQAHPCQKP